MKRLTKSRTNRVMDGVIGGLGEYFSIDPIILRILYLIFTISTGIIGGVILYIIAMLIMPPGEYFKDQFDDSFHERPTRSANSQSGPLWIGLILIIIGAVLLIRNVFDFDLWYYLRRYSEYLWGLGLVALGLLFIVTGGKKR